MDRAGRTTLLAVGSLSFEHRGAVGGSSPRSDLQSHLSASGEDLEGVQDMSQGDE